MEPESLGLTVIKTESRALSPHKRNNWSHASYNAFDDVENMLQTMERSQQPRVRLHHPQSLLMSELMLVLLSELRTKTNIAVNSKLLPCNFLF
jgi:hypothetical protein